MISALHELVRACSSLTQFDSIYHKFHMYMAYPQYEQTRVSKLPACLNNGSQTLLTNIFSPVYTVVWRLNVYALLKQFPQISHVYVFPPA